MENPQHLHLGPGGVERGGAGAGLPPGGFRAGASLGFLQEGFQLGVGSRGVFWEREAGRQQSSPRLGPPCDSAVGWKEAGLGEEWEPGGWQNTQLTRPICSPSTRSSWFSAHLSCGRGSMGARSEGKACWAL